jgi:hypothetical protein
MKYNKMVVKKKTAISPNKLKTKFIDLTPFSIIFNNPKD